MPAHSYKVIDVDFFIYFIHILFISSRFADFLFNTHGFKGVRPWNHFHQKLYLKHIVSCRQAILA
jgi:hypothetical protein